MPSSQEQRALELFAQIETWRGRGYDPQLIGNPNGWMVILDSTKWQDINERSEGAIMRFCTARHPTPEAAIEAALLAVRP